MLVVLGDLMLDQDFFFHSIRKSPEGNFPVVTLEKATSRWGGAGAVVNMLKGLKEEKYKFLRARKPPCNKDRYFIDGKQIFRSDCDKIFDIPDEEAEKIVDKISKKDLVLVADYGKGAITAYLIQLLLDKVEKVIIDPAKNRDVDFYSGAYAIIPNRIEAGILPNSSTRISLSDAEWSWKDKYLEFFQNTCIKLDKDGMLCNGVHIPAEQREIVDVCGAGDMVLAAIGHRLLIGDSFHNACVFANSKAGRVCLTQGATYHGD